MTIVALVFLAGGYLAGSTGAGLSGWQSASVYDATLAAHRDDSPLSQGAQLASIFAIATPADLDGITRAYEAIQSGTGPSPLANELLGELFSRHDPAAALARAKGWDAYWYAQFVPHLMEAWARRDDGAAQNAAAALAGDRVRSEAEQGVAMQPWALQAATRLEAIAWLEKQPDGVVVPILDIYARALAPVDFARAVKVAERIDHPVVREQILSIVKTQAPRG